MTNILVTGVGSLIGQGIIKTLNFSDIKCRIVGTDYFPHAVGLYWVDKGYILKDILSDDVAEEDWVEDVLKIIKSEDIDVVLIGLDFEVEVFARYKEIIEAKSKAKVIVGGLEQIHICKDKWKTAQFLKDNKLPYPESCLPEDLESFLESGIKFPLIVKPRFGFRSKDVVIVKNNDELNVAVKACPSPVIQEFVGSMEEEYTCGSLFIDGKNLSSICLRRSLKDGNTSRAMIDEQCHELDAFIKEVASKLKLYGPANYQLRKTEKGPVIFEINPRFSGTTPIRAMFGVNEVEMLLKTVLWKEDVSPCTGKEGVVLRYFEDQFVSLQDYNKWMKI